MSVIVEFDNISKNIGDYSILENVSLCLNQGEIHAIIGDNGAGKSTLMSILAGLQTYDSGKVMINGRQMPATYNSSYAAKSGVTMICQQSILVPYMDVTENVLLSNYPHRKIGPLSINDRKAARKKTKSIFEQLQYEVDTTKLVKYLGQAEQRMVEIAKALVSDSKIIILDEITRGLNDDETDILFKQLKILRSMGIGIFYITQNISSVFRIADTISILNDGKLSGTYPNNESTKQLIIKEVDFKKRIGYPKLPSAKGQEILRVEHLSNENILKDINFSLKKGEIFGVTGVAGSGRSSLARCLFGMDPTRRGDIFINGKLSKIKSPKAAFKKHIILVQDDPDLGLVPGMNPVQNVTLAPISNKLINRIFRPKRELNNARLLLSRLGVGKVKFSYSSANLSNGEKQKIIFGKILAFKAEIIIFDEPTARLDSVSKIEFYNLISELSMKGVAVIFISCNTDELMGMCDRIMVLNKGQKVLELLQGDYDQQMSLKLISEQPASNP